ncbi:F0F1 ATP synthase subunit delta [Geomicrobium sediminis]|uniref:ATP synthase subunit delta n=1 Tax=Geomicrobium sediminis TaxID=1347788 RepID=A0ABS2P7P6_9BACL|nr:F0F1 ATP synthase subunit delta [Geomicrobium sediminis]MBM7631432.1 F-type H+-transporting ATPase subunit delta [Geomicrobium sediminis]
MSDFQVAGRYGSALFQLAKEKEVLSRVSEELTTVKSVFESLPELQAILAHPRLSKSEKRALLQDGFSAMHDYVKNTLYVLNDRDRMAALPYVIDEFVALANEALGIEEATVYSVRALTDEELQAITSKFQAKIGDRELRVKNETDKDMLGGLIVRIGDTVYDGSVRNQLKKLERQIMSV